MKSSKFKQILDETSITLNESRNVVINRLMQQNGICRNEDTYGSYLWFGCNKKGVFRVNSPGKHHDGRGSRTYCVEGEVIEENGKTIVKIYSVYNKTLRIFTYISAIISVMYAMFLILIMYFNTGFSTMLVATILPLVFVYYISFSKFCKDEKNKNADFEIMKREAINRVEAIKLWDK